MTASRGAPTDPPAANGKFPCNRPRIWFTGSALVRQPGKAVGAAPAQRFRPRARLPAGRPGSRNLPGAVSRDGKRPWLNFRSAAGRLASHSSRVLAPRPGEPCRSGSLTSAPPEPASHSAKNYRMTPSVLSNSPLRSAPSLSPPGSFGAESLERSRPRRGGGKSSIKAGWLSWISPQINNPPWGASWRSWLRGAPCGMTAHPNQSCSPPGCGWFAARGWGACSRMAG
jgi:hypothetical protein